MKSAKWSQPADRVLFVLGACAVGGYFLWLAGAGLRAGLTHDDLMNLYRGWNQSAWSLIKDSLLFFTSAISYRPLGTLFYHILFALFDFNPLPFRVACYALLAANIFLVYCFARRLTGSREIAAIASLLHCYHGGFRSLYLDTGTCFDILCFFFYFGALVYYLRLRQRGEIPGVLHVLVFSALYVSSLNSKEMAVTMPVLILGYELLYNPPGVQGPGKVWRWALREGRVAGISAAIAGAFVVGRVGARDGLMTLSNYVPTVTLGAYVGYMQKSLNELFYQDGWFDPSRTVGLLLAMPAIGVLGRRRHLVLSWLLLSLGVLPVAFIPPRALSAMYIPLVGAAVYGATILVWGREALWRVLAPTGSPATAKGGQVGLVVGLLLVLGRTHAAYGALDAGWLAPHYEEIVRVRNQFEELHAGVRLGSRILILKDPFDEAPQKSWATVFIIYLKYKDRTLRVDRAAAMEKKPDAATIATYDYVFTTEEGRLVEMGVEARGKSKPEGSP